MKLTTTSLASWFKAYLPPFLWAGVIFLFSAQSVLPGFDVSLYDFLLVNACHMTVCAGLYFLLYRAVKMTSHFLLQALYLVVPLVLCLIYAITDELHQSTVPVRYPTARDIGYDMLGASVALLK